MNVQPFITAESGRKPRAAIFLSGGGSNAERLLGGLRDAGKHAAWECAALVTDAPATSRAAELARTFGVPLVANDIREFYKAGGEARVTLATPKGRELREGWTRELRGQLAPHKPDFGILAGFVPLTNLTGDFPCLNVHPGDLTYLKDGQRWLVGLHTFPIERAILEGLNELRSSVIVALPYTGSGGDMDNGPILGLSPAVPVTLGGKPLEYWREQAAQRPAQRPAGGWKDELEALAAVNQNSLKEGGDWVVFPKTVEAFARGLYARDEKGGLLFRGLPVETVVYGTDSVEVRFRAAAEA